jgi:hypothetical protein
MTHSRKVLVFLYALLFGTVAMAQTPPALTESQQDAMALLLDMATQLGDAPKFRVEIMIGYDAVQSDGQKIEFGERRQVSLERPSLMLNDVQDSDGSRESILFDGKTISVTNSHHNVYATAPQPGDIDTTVKYFVGQLHMRLPLAAMMMSGFPKELQKRVTQIAYVEETDILGEPAHHLAGRMKDIDFQVWISTDNRALPLRIIITYREDAGQPQFRANFANWNFSPSFLQKTFQFEPPAGAREVPLAAAFTQDSATNTETGISPIPAGEKP